MYNTRSIDVAIGIIVMALTVFALIMIFKHDTTMLETSKYTLRAEFERVDGIKVGSDVKIAGVKVGKVSEISINEDYLALLKIEIIGNIRVPSDSVAEIISDSLIGNKYVNLNIGSSNQYLADDGKFEWTQPPVNIESLVGKYIFGIDNAKTDESADTSNNGKSE
ncbi:Putative phospholipid ABC transporter substrate binding protein [Candidatus Fokinia solitaria]|uniref:Phospholipid ABC transporter substrate binding protein n=1 Tax=Candidatus Fokinia solitaria TaxID=1802984 RepID=A0A2U8BRT1_9RICK|nr:MlaD family protein [Candidatus Fokinia solitaria]AWD33042.1 Putative phospholipid ABC transporter substrate binding protein [Candidatus Fokinia solitaria]